MKGWDDMICRYTAATAKGGRRENQDNMRVDAVVRVDTKKAVNRSGEFSDGETHLFCVCDGIGGEHAGVVASSTALDALEWSLARSPSDAPLEQLLLDAVQCAHREVSRYYLASRRLGGTTICAVAVRGSEYFFLNIGDSPAFHYRAAEGECAEISLRHNLETRKKLKGKTASPGDSSILTAYLGDARRNAAQMAHTASGSLAPGDALLICSDGVTNAYDPERLKEAMKRGVSAEEMVSRAAAGARADNCTAIHLLFRNA